MNFNQLAEFFKIFSDPTRLRIINFLIGKEANVQTICKELDLFQTTVSHQLQLLRNNRLVNYRRQGKEIFYSLDDEHIAIIFKIGSEHIEEV